MMKKLTLITLLTLTATHALAATYDEDLQKLNTKWELKRSKEKIKIAQKVELAKFKTTQKRQLLEGELKTVELSLSPKK